MSIEEYLKIYIRERPLFLSTLRAKECALYQPYLPLVGPSLDYGCGDGFFARTTFGELGVGIGLDMKESRIDQATNSHAYKKIVTYDGEKIPLASRSQKTVVSNSVLEHVTHLSNALSEIHRILAPGGRFITTVMAKPWEEHLAGTIMGAWYKDYMRTKQVHVNLYTYKQWQHAFVTAGFRVTKVIGHLPPKACTLLDVLHYASVPSLVSFMLFKKWVLYPEFATLYPTAWLAKQMEPNVQPEESGALFFVLTKQ
jgi:SAM-dependent methyltransferase